MKYTITISTDSIVRLRRITKALEEIAVDQEKERSLFEKFAAKPEAQVETEAQDEAKADDKTDDKVVDIATEKAERKTKAAKTAKVKADAREAHAAKQDDKTTDKDREAALAICRVLFQTGTDAAVRDVKKLRDEMGVEKLTYVTAEQVPDLLAKAQKLYEKHVQPKGAA